MFATILTLASAAALVAGIAIPRAQVPSNWWTAGLEPYDTYHSRYVALDCISQHNSSFFNTCCHPLLKDESLSDRPAECDPANDCDDGDDGDDSGSSSAPAPSSTPAPVNVAPDPATTTTSKKVPTSTEAPSTPTSEPSPTSDPSSGNTLVTGSGRGTFYYQNGVVAACGGKPHQDSEKIVALDSQLYDNGKYCGKTVTITNTENGKSVTATVADECPTCASWGSIDMSTGTFDELASESEGDIPISWKLSS